MIRSREPAVNVQGVSVAYDHVVALDRIEVTIKPGTLAAVIGPNGGGKSTLLKTMVGLVKPTCGKVQVLGLPVPLARSRVAYLPQAEEVDWQFPISVLEVVLQGRLVRLPWWKRLSSKERQIGRECLRMVGMESAAERPIGSLSGGQRQRVFLARALSQEADLIIMDEPAAALDAAAQHDLLELFVEMKKLGRTVLISTHDLNCLADFFDHVIALNQQIIGQGPPAEILDASLLTRLFSRHFPLVLPSGAVTIHDS